MPGETHPDLWVEVASYPGRLFIMGNPHTFTGRITGWSFDRDESFYFSKGDVTDASDAARWWLDGYLHGSEPEFEQFFALDPSTLGEIDDDDARWAEWRAALQEFRATGKLPPEYAARAFGLRGSDE
jgi:hypothetical protein